MEYEDAPDDVGKGDGGMSADELRRLGQKWLTRIKASEKREKAWIDNAGEARKAYLADRESQEDGKVYQFNILHSNIETIVPAVFNSAPVPDIRERFRTGPHTPESATAVGLSHVLERAISVQVDDGALETEMEDMTTDALLAGRGVIRVRFDADEAVDEMGQPMVTGERLTYEAVAWSDYREGPAKRWKDVPWVAFQHCLPWEEVQRIQDPELKEKLAVSGDQGDEPDGDSDTHIWEIWCKATGKVYMIVRETGDILSMTDDPMGLSGFFPCPKPVQPIGITGSRTPVAPFTIYKALAEELETITRRIKAITSGLKVRGFIVGNAADIEALSMEGDNTLIPIANMEGMAATGGLDKAISWWPVDKAIQVMRELYISRDQCKAMIYEVTGISDIVRGQGSAQETATAQEIKSQWGSIRIRKLQRQIERCAREVFVLSAEIINSKFSPMTLQRMTGIPMTPEIMAMINQPLDAYRIDVESDSTVRADLSRRKGEMGEFLQGTASFFSTMAPLVGQAPELAAPVSEIYASFARQFNLGKQAEDALERMAETAKQPRPQQQGPTPEQMKMQADAAALQAKMEMEGQLKQAEFGLKREETAANIQLEREKLMANVELKREEIAMKREGKGADTSIRIGGDDGSAAVEVLMQGLSGLMAAIQQGQQMAADSGAAQTTALVQEIQRGNAGVVAAMLAPKEVIRDANGRPVGVQTRVN